MQQPPPSGPILGWTSGKGSVVLTRQKIIDAIKDEDSKSVISTETKEFIRLIIMPYLKTVRDEPQHLATILVGIINVIYLNCSPDSEYLSTPFYSTDDPKPIIPQYPNISEFREQWDGHYQDWLDRVVLKQKAPSDNTRTDKTIDFSTFDACLLAAIPEDGTIFFTNPKIFTQLQTLARRYIVIEQPVEKSANSFELTIMRQTR